MPTIRQRWHRLYRVRPFILEQLHAMRVAVGLAIPAAVLLALGRPDMMIYATFGAVTGMYARGEVGRGRLVHQANGSALLLVAGGIGVLLANLLVPPDVLVAAIAVFAAVASVVSDRLALRPGGPFFGIFALGAIAGVPASRYEPWLALAVYVGTVVWCLMLGFVTTMGLPAWRAPRAGVRPPPWRTTVTGAVGNAIAIGLAGAGGIHLGTDHVVWAMTAAITPMAVVSVRTRLWDGVRRFLGTLAGLVVAGLLLIPGPSPTVLVICLVALLGPTEILLPRSPALALGVFTPLIMVMTDLANPDSPLLLLVDRGVDTVIGITTGTAVALVVMRLLRVVRPILGNQSDPVATRPGG